MACKITKKSATAIILTEFFFIKITNRNTSPRLSSFSGAGQEPPAATLHSTDAIETEEAGRRVARHGDRKARATATEWHHWPADIRARSRGAGDPGGSC